MRRIIIYPTSPCPPQPGPVASVAMVTDLLRAAVTLLPDVHQAVATVGGAVGLVRMRDVEETRPPRQQDHLLKVVGAAAAEVARIPAGTGKEPRPCDPRWELPSDPRPHPRLCVCVCVAYVVPEFMMQAGEGQVQDRPSSWFIPRL